MSETLAFWTHGLRYEDLPVSAVASSKRLLLDTLAVAWAGSGVQGVEVVCEVVRRQAGKPDSRVWITGERLPAVSASLVNGLCASALDFDSVHGKATVHPDIVVLPALMAVADQSTTSGKQFIAAHVAGDEMLVRLGLGVMRHPGWFFSSVLGVFACAAACAKMLGLDRAGVHRAMGIALSRACGSQQALVEGSFAKRLQTAFAARDGLEAALFAQCGVSGPLAMFEGQAGFEALYVDLDREAVLGGLGSSLRFEELTLKSFPSCFGNHAAIQATIELKQRHGIEVCDIQACTVAIPPFSARLVGSAFSPNVDPQAAAQFSVQYSVANALLRGGLSVADLEPGAVMQPDILMLASRVRVEIDESQTAKFIPATVTVLMRNGVQVSGTTTTIPGTPERPLSDEQLRCKAMQCFSGGRHPLPTWRAEMLISRIDALESLEDMRDLLGS